MYLFFGIFFVLALLCILLFHRRKACIIKKVCSMSQTEKCRLLNELILPFGYQYLPCQDIFYSDFDAWQRDFGYRHSYDCSAPFFNMVFDCEPIYFNYDNRTWLVELWKGQYGINTGAEIGIYCADSIVPLQKRKRTHFHTIANEDIPNFTMNLRRMEDHKASEIASLSMPHWWLAAFRMGCFSRPGNLCADFCISFTDCGMAYAFADALSELGYDICAPQICDSCVCLAFRDPFTPVPGGCLSLPIRCLAQWKNLLFCKVYRFATRPFCCTVDRLLLLYFYLPFGFRHCLRLRRCKKFHYRGKKS